MEHEQIIPKLRVGVFYDGYYFSRTSNYYKGEHTVGEHIHIEGLNNFILEKVAQARGINPKSCYVATSQYFSGRNSIEDISYPTWKLSEERKVDEILRKKNINPNYIPNENGKEKGVDVFLAITVQGMVIDLQLDVAVLVTGDGDFQTLPLELSRRGCETMLVCWDYDSHPKPDGSPSQTRTSRYILDSVHYPLEMYPIIEEGLRKNDPLILGLFGIKPMEQKKAVKSPRYLLGQIKSLHKREGVVEVQSSSIKFYANDQDLGIDLKELKKGDWVKLQKEKVGNVDRVFDFQMFKNSVGQ